MKRIVTRHAMLFPNKYQIDFKCFELNLCDYYSKWAIQRRLSMKFWKIIFERFVFVQTYQNSFWDFQKLWVTFPPNKCPHAKQVAPCQDLEKCADGGWGAVLIDLSGHICSLLNSPSSLHGVSLMEIEYQHHSCIEPPPHGNWFWRWLQTQLFTSPVLFPGNLIPPWIRQFAPAPGQWRSANV